MASYGPRVSSESNQHLSKVDLAPEIKAEFDNTNHNDDSKLIA